MKFATKSDMDKNTPEYHILCFLYAHRGKLVDLHNLEYFNNLSSEHKFLSVEYLLYKGYITPCIERYIGHKHIGNTQITEAGVQRFLMYE